MNVREILSSFYKADITSISYQEKVELTQQIRSAVKENIGHGVSQEYYDRHWSFYSVNPKYVPTMVVNAKFCLGAWSNKNVFKGRPKKKTEDK